MHTGWCHGEQSTCDFSISDFCFTSVGKFFVDSSRAPGYNSFCKIIVPLSEKMGLEVSFFLTRESVYLILPDADLDVHNLHCSRKHFKRLSGYIRNNWCCWHLDGVLWVVRSNLTFFKKCCFVIVIKTHVLALGWRAFGATHGAMDSTAHIKL